MVSPSATCLPSIAARRGAPGAIVETWSRSSFNCPVDWSSWSVPCPNRSFRYNSRSVIRRFTCIAIVAFAAGLPCQEAPAQQSGSFTGAGSADLNYKQFGMLAIQDGGRRKPVDTFARESLIRITGRSTFRDKTGRVWQPNDFALSALLETRDWRNESMVLVSLGKLKQKLGLSVTARRFTFAELTASRN